MKKSKLNDQQLLNKAAKRLEKWARRADRKAEGQDWHALHLPPNENSEKSAYWVETVPKRGKSGGYKPGSIHTVADVVWGVPDMVYIALVQPKVGIALASLMKRRAVDCQLLGTPPELIYIARQVLKTKYRKGTWIGD